MHHPSVSGMSQRRLPLAGVSRAKKDSKIRSASVDSSSAELRRLDAIINFPSRMFINIFHRAALLRRRSRGKQRDVLWTDMGSSTLIKRFPQSDWRDDLLLNISSFLSLPFAHSRAMHEDDFCQSIRQLVLEEAPEQIALCRHSGPYSASLSIWNNWN